MKPARSRIPAALVPARQPSRATIIAGLFVIAIGLRAMNVWRPVDGSIWNGSREADTAALARNFDREGMNVLYPRIDWRGEGPGYVECGFPLQPYLGAALYRVFGYHEQYLRLISLAASILACYVFWRLADRVLPHWPAVIAFGFFTSQPLLVAAASWIQPESLLLLVYIAAVDHFDRWSDAPAWRRWVSAWSTTTLAILISLPAAHVGILFALIGVRKFGLGTARRIDLWAFFVLCGSPPLLWFTHAHTLWRDHGNSLGVFNEASSLLAPSSAMGTIPGALLGAIAIEGAHVWTPMGVGFIFSAVRGVWRARTGLLIDWTIALVVYYLATARTAGSPATYYYHIVSVPLVALAVGMSAQLLFDAVAAGPRDLRVGRGVVRQMWLALAAIASAYALLGGAIHYLAGQSAVLLAIASAITLFGGAVLIYLDRWARGRSPRARSRRLRVWLAGIATAGSLIAGWNVAEIRRYFQGQPEMFAKYEAALQFAPRLRDKGPLAIAGAEVRDSFDQPRPANVPYFFYWLDRKGFAVSADRLSVERLQDLTRRGVRFFIVERDAWDRAPILEGIMRRRFRVVEDHPMATLFDLTRPEDDTPSRQ